MAEKEAETQLIEEPVAEQPQPTAEEQLETAQATIEDLEGKYHKSEESIKGLRGSLKEKDRKIDTISSGQSAEMVAMNERISLIATAISMGRTEGDMDDVSKDTQKQILGQLTQIGETEKQRRQAADVKSDQDAYVSKAQDILANATDAGLKEGSVLYEQIFADLQSRNDKLATARLNEYVASKKQEPVVDDEQEKLKKANALKVDTGSPSGPNMNDAAFTERYNSGELNSSEDHKRASAILNRLKGG